MDENNQQVAKPTNAVCKYPGIKPSPHLSNILSLCHNYVLPAAHCEQYEKYYFNLFSCY